MVWIKLFILVLFFLSNIGFVDSAFLDVGNPIQAIQLQGKSFIRKSMTISQSDLEQFHKNAWVGCEGQPDIYRDLCCIAVEECNENLKTRKKFGMLGGFWPTIIKGSKELGEIHSDLYIRKHPFFKTKALARRFETLYKVYGEEKACRVWNEGPNWKSENGQSYWNNIQVFKKRYDKCVVN